MTFRTIDQQRLEEMTAWVEKHPEKAAREIMINRGLTKQAEPPPPPKGPGPRNPYDKMD